MISEFIDRQATNTDLFELEDVLTGEKRQYRIVSKATVTVPGTDLNKATLDPYWRLSFPRQESRIRGDRRLPGIGLNMTTGR